MSRFYGIIALALLLCVAYAPPASADTIYTYTGNPFMFSSGTLPPGVSKITGSFTVASPLGANLVLSVISPLSFSFSNGASPFTPAALGFQLAMGTNSTGSITRWFVTISNSSTNLTTMDCCSNKIFDITGNIAGAFAGNNHSPGKWTSRSSVVVPEPSSLILLGSGLLGVLGAARRRLRV